MKPEHANRLKALFAKTTTPALVDALLILEAKRTGSRLDEFELVSRAWIIEELERRFPAASDAVHAAFLASEVALAAGGEYTEVDYVEVLVTHIAIDQVCKQIQGHPTALRTQDVYALRGIDADAFEAAVGAGRITTADGFAVVIS